MAPSETKLAQIQQRFETLIHWTKMKMHGQTFLQTSDELMENATLNITIDMQHSFLSKKNICS